MDHSALKNMKRYLSLAGLLCAAVLTSCDKNGVQDITAAPPASRIKFFNFGVNAPGVNFYANDTKMTAINSATGVESTTGVAYGLVGSGGFYGGIAPGQYTLTGKIAATTDKDLAIASVAATIADGKYYSFYQSGFYNTAAKTVESFVVEDPVPAVDYTVAYVRFVNAISNSSAMTLYAQNTVTAAETALGAAAAYKAAGAFTSVPEGVYDLNTRVAGSATNVISRAAVSFLAGRVYTIGARGDMTVVSGTATNRPFLDNTANR
jgi:Domain of unknown function (DUF4397)